MITPASPVNEDSRLKEVSSLLYDYAPDKNAIDDITAIASYVCNTPISIISIVEKEKQIFVSKIGLLPDETSKDVSFCAHAINNPDEIMEINDARDDPRFYDNPLVTSYPNIVFYAGAPLVSSTGMALGTLCVIDNFPKKLNEHQRDVLFKLSRHVVRLFELSKAGKELRDAEQKLSKNYAELEKFSYVLAHDIKSPVSNLSNIIGFLKRVETKNLSEKGIQLLDTLQMSVKQIQLLLDGIISYYTHLNVEVSQKSMVNLKDLMEVLIFLLNGDNHIKISSEVTNVNLYVNEQSLKQILLNLLSNSIKYNNQEVIEISLVCTESKTHYHFQYKDNGIGIEQSRLNKIFEVFYTLGVKDRYGMKGSGIGLAIVKELVNKLGGEIRVDSTPGMGSTFMFSISL